MIQFFSKKHIYRLNDAVTNISCGITQQVTGAFVKVFTIAAFLFVSENWAVFDIPVTWWSIVLLALGVDLCYYWSHRMSHEINLFWGGHVVHHQSEDYNFSVALRQGSFQGIWTFWFYMPLAFLGFDPTMFLLISALNTVYQFWIHTETIGKLPKPIEFIFNTPSHHRVHHGRDPKYIDKNHAGSLIIWDRMFGTFQEEEERPTYGITTPINTWNPVWANLQHYVGMADQLRETPGIMNKLKVVWYKPGWRPEELGGYQAPKAVDKDTYTKYNNNPALKLSIYVLVQFIAILGVTSLFLFTADNMQFNQKLAFSVLIIWSVAQFGILFDNKTRWVNMEYFRIFIASATSSYLMDANWIAMLSGAFAIVSAMSFFLIRREEPKVETVKA
ncbi:sterol desaturase family protein [Marinoscillum pacificum]|uniref:sterol desaturase family protein n=1 Tax=Marinoscillum pacificum TaxID=392723 RepID=UPI0021574BC7|nr:sterol desaturase family protein [Marinoscillum pacificum]